MEKFSILLPVYRTESDAEDILQELLSEEVEDLEKIIVVVDEGKIETEDPKIELIRNEKRVGKSKAITQALSVSKTDLNVLLSSDIVISLETVLKMVRKTSKDTVVTPRIKPLDSGTKASRIADQIWEYHRRLSREQPKVGEAIAFKGIDSIPEETIADEEFISSKTENSVYLEDCLVYNKPPSSVKQLYKQRRRVFTGHLQLIRSNRYVAPSTKIHKLTRIVKRDIRRNSNYVTVLQTVLLEFAARADAVLRTLLGRKSYKWDRIQTSARGSGP